MTRRAYYNDNSPDAAAWLRELIAAGLIMAGDVDERSIVDVRPADLKGFTRHHFFAGVAGWELALQLADWPDDRPVATASLPCQPFSNAGKRQGVKDERHLWPVFAELVRECGFATIFGEQVESAIRHGWLDGVFADLEQLGYACAAGCLPAACVGAPHIRQRLFWLAHRGGSGLARRQEQPAREERSAPERSGELGGLGNAAAGGRGIGGHEAQPGSGGHALGAGGAGLGGVEYADERGRPRGERPGSGDNGRHGPPQGFDVRPAAPDSGPWSDFILIPCRDGKVRRACPRIPVVAARIPRDVAMLMPRLAKLGHDPTAARRIIREARRHRVVALKGAGNSIVPPLAAEFIRAAMEATVDS